MKLRVLLADDHVLVREGIGNLLRQDPEIEVVGEAGTGSMAVSMARQAKPDLVIMDVVMPEMTGAEATRQIVRENGKVKVLALSMYDTEAHISNMIEAGAAGYMLKTSAYEELARAIGVVLKGDIYLCSNITAVIVKDHLERMRSGYRQPAGRLGLSAREREVLSMIAEGRSSKEIARLLGVRPKTVDSHRVHIMSKLKITNVAGLTKYALKEGLTAIDS